jgi:hypothetical protein
MRRRSIVFAFLAVATSSAVTATAEGSGALNPCKLVTRADAHAVLGASVQPGTLQTLGLYGSCTYRTAKFVTLTVQTRSMSRGDFVRSAKANPGPVKAVGGIGALAYSAGGGVTLLVWRKGSEATFSIYGAGPALAREITLAKRVVSRL